MTRLTIRPDIPWFDGHFPGRPVLPGVAQLALLDDLLRSGGRRLHGFEKLRFRKEILPGHEIDIEIHDGAGPGLARFSIKRGDEIACEGLARVSPAEAIAPSPPPPVPSVPDPALPPIESLIPHRGAMRFVEALVSSTPEGTTALARVPVASPFARDGIAPAVLVLEIAAQAAASRGSLVRRRDTGAAAAPREGRLVGARDVALIAAGAPLGVPLVVSVVPEPSVAPLAIFRATIAAEGRVLATGRLSTYLL